ncbi:MAG: TonB-dependent receptor, partial [Bacteroidetes bacterium]|nr:TonB-dependent receptor [Bacteroidota bacterium]
AAPYIPTSIINFSLNYGYKAFMIGANYNMVGAQYTDYLNFNNETGEGAIGKLKAFKTIDLNASYALSHSKNKFVKGMTLFVAAKNITNEVFMASRLHRVSSGIMPGGFRQVNAGVRVNI